MKFRTDCTNSSPLLPLYWMYVQTRTIPVCSFGRIFKAINFLSALGFRRVEPREENQTIDFSMQDKMMKYIFVKYFTLTHQKKNES